MTGRLEALKLAEVLEALSLAADDPEILDMEVEGGLLLEIF